MISCYFPQSMVNIMEFSCCREMWCPTFSRCPGFWVEGVMNWAACVLISSHPLSSQCCPNPGNTIHIENWLQSVSHIMNGIPWEYNYPAMSLLLGF